MHAYGRISRSMRHTHVAAAAKPGDGIGKGGGQEDALLTHLSRMADKYILGAASQGALTLPMGLTESFSCHHGHC